MSSRSTNRRFKPARRSESRCSASMLPCYPKLTRAVGTSAGAIVRGHRTARIRTMAESLLTHEPTVRMAAFMAVLVLVAGWECIAPRRRADGTPSRWARWPANLGIVVIDGLVLRLAFPILAVGLAELAAARQWGLLNTLSVPSSLAGVVSLIALDLTIYLQHVMFHAVPALWRLHRMHHADLAFDTTTGVRFHPIEIVLSMVIKLTVVAALGPPAWAVLVFEVVLNATALFNHGNIRIPTAIERSLRLVVVTPDMHRVHHSVHRDETNSNFGFNLPWWDRLFGTYRDAPRDGHERMRIGLPIFRDPKELRLERMLLQPFRDERESDPSLSSEP